MTEQPKREAWEIVRDALVLFGKDANLNPGKFGEYIAKTALSTQAAELERVKGELAELRGSVLHELESLRNEYAQSHGMREYNGGRMDAVDAMRRRIDVLLK